MHQPDLELAWLGVGEEGTMVGVGVHPETEDLILGSGSYIDERKANEIEGAGIESVMIRSVLTCETKKGVCSKCYGKNLATGRISEEGDAGRQAEDGACGGAEAAE